MTKPEVLKFKSYLTVEAQVEFDQLVQLGLDPDLALEILEKELGDVIYDLTKEIEEEQE